MIQNTLGNFIRTGDPNNWEGNSRPYQDIGRISSWWESNRFNIYGISGTKLEDYRKEYCDKLDDMDEYMLH